MEMTSKTGVLLVNLGTPNAPTPSAVSRYLTEFLLDPRVIDYPWLFRNLLVRGLIVPLRKKRIAKAYKSIWTENGSPLLSHLKDNKLSLQKALGPSFHVSIAMRYQTPSIVDGLKELESAQVDKIVVLPLFPQYAAATTGSIFEKTMQTILKWQTPPKISFINNFYSHPLFSEAFAKVSEKYTFANYDKILFSFHGLPERHIKNADSSKTCLLAKNCCEKNFSCYRAQCLETAKQIADKLKIAPNCYTVCFQSRLGQDEWLKPYTSHVVKSLAKDGAKKLLVFSPAFVADCLETLYEIQVELQDEFRSFGGEKIDLVESLNSEEIWIHLLRNLILEHT
jgi:protoporphyrin/coproporphyrin ferrochelatase